MQTCHGSPLIGTLSVSPVNVTSAGSPDRLARKDLDRPAVAAGPLKLTAMYRKNTAN